jgi:hypothetical protein
MVGNYVVQPQKMVQPRSRQMQTRRQARPSYEPPVTRTASPRVTTMASPKSKKTSKTRKRSGYIELPSERRENRKAKPPPKSTEKDDSSYEDVDSPVDDNITTPTIPFDDLYTKSQASATTDEDRKPAAKKSKKNDTPTKNSPVPSDITTREGHDNDFEEDDTDKDDTDNLAKKPEGPPKNDIYKKHNSKKHNETGKVSVARMEEIDELTVETIVSLDSRMRQTPVVKRLITAISGLQKNLEDLTDQINLSTDFGTGRSKAKTKNAAVLKELTTQQASALAIEVRHRFSTLKFVTKTVLLQHGTNLFDRWFNALGIRESTERQALQDSVQRTVKDTISQHRAEFARALKNVCFGKLPELLLKLIY